MERSYRWDTGATEDTVLGAIQRGPTTQRGVSPSAPQVNEEGRAALARAGERLGRLSLYSRPVDMTRVRLITLPLFFRIPGFRRYQGYALWRTILLRRPLAETSDDLITHELCHVWQMQHRPWHVLWTWLTTRYDRNPYELEARRADRGTR